MSDFKNITALVKAILENEPESRNSDNYLYYAVYRSVCPVSLSAEDMLLYQKAYGLPPFESVRRARQKIQRKFPELKACDNVQSLRAIEEIRYQEYARS